MDEKPTPKTRQSGHGRARVLAFTVLAVAVLAMALFVVVRSLRNVEPATLPPALKKAPPDTALTGFRASIRRRVRILSARCASKRKGLGEEMTAEQDSMSQECDSAIAAILARVAALDTVKREHRKEAADSVKAEYERAKLNVRTFTRSGSRRDRIDEDSLDAELEKFISR
jgi:hypothetical protein